ncbi:hypothetical protein V8C26DRAFT_155097 [Trichoderma gracile]
MPLPELGTDDSESDMPTCIPIVPETGTYIPPIRAFEPPEWFRNSQARRWYQTTDEMRSDELLWRTYWKRFNTVEIPILPQDEYFETALSISKLAGGRRDDFERIFEERKKEWWEGAKRQVAETLSHADSHREAFPCDDAQEKMIRACGTGCLTHFLDILKGDTFGYEADVVRDESLDNVPSNLERETEKAEYEQAWKDAAWDPVMNDMSPEEVQALKHEMYVTRSQTMDYDPDVCFYKEPSVKDWREPLMADNVFYIGSYTVEYARPELDPETGRTSSMSPLLPSSASASQKGDKAKTTQKKRKRKSVRFDDIVDVESHQHREQLGSDDDKGDDDRAHKRARLDSSSPHASSVVQPASDDRASKKRKRHDGDHAVSQKRQKLETPTGPVPAPHASSPIPTATTKTKPLRRIRRNKGYNQRRTQQGLEDPPPRPPTPSASSTTATDSTRSRKRSRQGDDHDNGFKRQKIEDPTVHTPPSLSSSSTHQTTDERMNDQMEDARERRKRTGPSTRQSRRRPSPTPRPLNTRSRRRSGSSSFMELDHSGKPRLV